MHEHSFIQAIVSQIPDPEMVVRISLELGELAGIGPAHLKEHLEEETGWEVEVTTKESRVKCFCGYIGKAKITQRLHDLVIFECPVCGKMPEILEGRDIKLIKIDYK